MTETNPEESIVNGATTSTTHPPTTNGVDKQNHPPPVIVQETDDEDDVLDGSDDVMNAAAIELLALDEETLNSGAEGYVKSPYTLHYEERNDIYHMHYSITHQYHSIFQNQNTHTYT
jgi:hypothetical protein